MTMGEIFQIKGFGGLCTFCFCALGSLCRQHSAEVAHQPRASAKQRQGGRPREEAGPQAQEEPRGEEERGDDDGVPERLG